MTPPLRDRAAHYDERARKLRDAGNVCIDDMQGTLYYVGANAPRPLAVRFSRWLMHDGHTLILLAIPGEGVKTYTDT